MMADTGEEIVCEGVQCWIGTRQTSWGLVRGLLRLLALKDVSDTKGLQRFTINDTGRAILRRPELENEITYHILKGKPFTVVNDHIKALSR